MKRTPLMSFVLLAGCSAFLIGCQPSKEEMAAMMKQPPRSAELERLATLLGNWSVEGEFTMAGEDEGHKGTGSSSREWAVDQWVLVENWQFDMGEGNTMKGVMLTWWDRYAKKYRVVSTDNYGGRSIGTMIYDEEEGIWKAKSKGRDGVSGDRIVETWTMKLTDPSTIESTWVQYDGLGLFKKMEATGTAKRQ